MRGVAAFPHMIILFIIKVRILFLMKWWSYKSLQCCSPLSLEWLNKFWLSSPISIDLNTCCVFGVRSFILTQSHTQLKCRCLIKVSNRFLGPLVCHHKRHILSPGKGSQSPMMWWMRLTSRVHCESQWMWTQWWIGWIYWQAVLKCLILTFIHLLIALVFLFPFSFLFFFLQLSNQ
jgi:hypothetical protein